MNHSQLPSQVRAAERFALARAGAASGLSSRRCPLPGRLLREDTDLAAGGGAGAVPALRRRALMGSAHWHLDRRLPRAGRRPPAVTLRLIPVRGHQLSLEGRTSRRGGRGGARPPARGGGLARAHAPQSRGAGGGEGGCARGARAAAAAASACCSARAACSRRSVPARRLPSGHGRRGASGVESASPGPVSRALTVPVRGGGGGGDPASTLRGGSAGHGLPSGGPGGVVWELPPRKSLCKCIKPGCLLPLPFGRIPEAMFGSRPRGRPPV